MLVKSWEPRTILCILLLVSISIPFVISRPQTLGPKDLETSRLVKRDSGRLISRNGERIVNTDIRRVAADRIYFPEEVRDSVKDRVDIDLLPRVGDQAPRCANGSTFCEHVDAYPSHFVENILRRNKHYADFFALDDVPIEISNRVAGDLEKPICESRQQTVYPTVGETSTGEWKYIVNLKNTRNGLQREISQAVTVEICVGRERGNSCSLMDDISYGYTTYCKQKYTYRKLFSFNETAMIPYFFKMPSACCCVYKREPLFPT
ncbi:unnamed protein product [Acanthoscelides obtectus]|uniref:Spaetzle domain-containing protein n=1 Tax=Acanthoscelides obtectus TaxID=200917 RepID=A0A9P0L830_ACAOB|nr:unnamed protein product [Acanthoscelides obtectus]CAK1655285.1 Protein spaetzle [Acanthoscelides obtectus]